MNSYLIPFNYDKTYPLIRINLYEYLNLHCKLDEERSFMKYLNHVAIIQKTPLTKSWLGVFFHS